MENIYYIYFHINPLTNKIFYVGKGKGNRAYNKRQRNIYWNRYVAKYGLVVDIIESNLTNSLALEREVFYIKKIGRENLVNMTDGGDGSVGRIPWNKGMKGSIPWNKGKKNIYSKETLNKISESSKGRIPWNKGKEFSEESREKMRKSQIGNTNKRGKKVSEESRRKMSESARNRNKNKKK